MDKETNKLREEEDNEQGRGPGRDLPEANIDPEETPDTGIDRTQAPVQAPHWQALIDIGRVLPCQVQPVNSKDWYTVTKVRSENGEIVLTTSDGEDLWGRDIHDPVLVRTNDPDAGLLH